MEVAIPAYLYIREATAPNRSRAIESHLDIVGEQPSHLPKRSTLLVNQSLQATASV